MLFIRFENKKQQANLELSSPVKSVKSTESSNGLADTEEQGLANNEEHGLADTEESPEIKYGPIHIYFGSQTGTAQNYAKILAEEASGVGFEPIIIDLVDFHPTFFKDVKVGLFVVATHGEGGPTDNAKNFNEYIVGSERANSEFKGLKFATFGLGNRQYEFFCAQGKRTNENLERLGAERVYKYGEGDDNESLENDFNEWKSELWTELIKVYETFDGNISTAPAHARPSAKSARNPDLPFIVSLKSGLKEIDLDTYNAKNDGKEYDFQAKQYLSSVSAPLTFIRELRQKTDDDGSTLHVEIDLASTGITYKTAQNLAIYAENSPKVVAKVATLLNLNLSDVFAIEQNPAVHGQFKHPFPSPISVETYLTKLCDLQGALRKKQIKDLAQFCQNEDDKNKLLFLASNEGKAEFEAYIHSNMKGLVDVIENFNVKLSLENLIQISNLIMPRLYTIASSNKKYPNNVHLCVSIYQDRLPNGKNKMGLTSGFLIRKNEQFIQGKSMGNVKINIKDSTFSLPTDSTVPIIMVGPGAGIAPFKGFVDEKAYLARTSSGVQNPYGEMTLYFGCRGREWDYLYREELTQYCEEGIIKDHYVAFSRDQGHKVYVQDLIGKNKEEMTQLLFESNAVLYMCGSMAMGRSVMIKLVEIAGSYYGVEKKEAQEKIEELEKNKKIIRELWG